MKRLIIAACVCALLGGLVSCSLGRGEEVSSAEEPVSSEVSSVPFEMPDLNEVIRKPMPYKGYENMLYPIYKGGEPNAYGDLLEGSVSGDSDLIYFIDQEAQSAKLVGEPYHSFQYLMHPLDSRPIGIMAKRYTTYNRYETVMDIYTISGKRITIVPTRYQISLSYSSPHMVIETDDGYTVINIETGAFTFTKLNSMVYVIPYNLEKTTFEFIREEYSGERAATLYYKYTPDSKAWVEIDEAEYRGLIDILKDYGEYAGSVTGVKNGDPYTFVRKGIFQGYQDKNGEWVYRETAFGTLEDN
ncbi:MAG: hypothetical protein LBS74_07295 [Oscillospiraceae bacterium]|jgi:hypothetical protein|nr:hypothetical protein [Oscillospiraceae bacterium]